jgi:hypothetical protein
MPIHITVKYNDKPQTIVVTNRKCRICKKRFVYTDTSLKNQGRVHQADNSACTECQYWLDKFKEIDDPAYARIDGAQYRIGECLDNYELKPGDTLESIVKAYDSGKGNKGFGGSKFAIQFDDGRVVITDDLWHNGRVPAAWVDFLPNNAKFLVQGVN